MKAPQQILTVWQKFDGFPMETLTKAWYSTLGSKKRQREISLMKEHRQQYGIAGNCFDLAIWLLDEFQKEGIKAYPIGSEIETKGAHAAVVAVDERGMRYLCDLGDQWLTPILLDSHSEDFTDEKLGGYFPGAEVQVIQKKNEVEILYHRPNGKISQQLYQLEPIEMSDFLQAAEISQRNIYRKPLLECRVPYKSEIGHWEFYDWQSYFSTTEGLQEEERLNSNVEWAKKITVMTGYDQKLVEIALEVFASLEKKNRSV